MKKNYFMLFLLLSICTSAFAKTNLFCKNLDTADTECIKIAKEMYESRIDNLANEFVKMQKEKNGKIIDKQKALNATKEKHPIKKFMKSFKLCGEFSKTQEKAKLCLNSAFITNSEKENEQASTSPKTQASSSPIKNETQFQTKPLSKEMKEYISTRFKTVKNKKLVLYAEGAAKVPNCPHSKAFREIIDSGYKSKSLASYYSFQKFDLNQMGKGSETAMEKAFNFNEVCGVFCVVSLKNDWVYAPLGNSYYKNQTAILPFALISMKTKE